MGERLFLRVDGGGTQCRAHLADASGAVLGEGLAGPANIRRGLAASMAAVLTAARQCLTTPGLGDDALAATTPALPWPAPASRTISPPRGASGCRFTRTLIVTDAEAACIGAHDGGIVIVGTGSIGWAIRGGRQRRACRWSAGLRRQSNPIWPKMFGTGWSGRKFTRCAYPVGAPSAVLVRRKRPSAVARPRPGQQTLVRCDLR